MGYYLKEITPGHARWVKIGSKFDRYLSSREIESQRESWFAETELDIRDSVQESINCSPYDSD